MANYLKALIIADWKESLNIFEVQHNPTELSLDKSSQLAEIAIPGLDAPLQQFVRGQAEKLSIELFFDSTGEGGTGAGAVSVTKYTDKIYMLGKVESNSHAPPVVTFIWGFNMSGDHLADAMSRDSIALGSAPATNQTRYSFTGVVESIRQRYTLFSPLGVPLRATINLVLREYRPLDQQLYELGLNSPNKTHRRMLKNGDSLSGLSGEVYGQPGLWRKIADENAIDDPRRLETGTAVSIPAIK
ncbi:MAG: CIS tube protein [Gammaproteobacteria bacterium]